MGRKRKIVAPLAGNLNVLTLRPVLQRLIQDSSLEIVCVEGGAHPICHDLPFPVIAPSRTSGASLRAAIARPDLVLHAVSFLRGDVEQTILDEAARHSALELAYLCDVGGDFTLPKLRRWRRACTQHVLVTDPRTYRSLVVHGVEGRRLIKAGSPVLDRTLRTPTPAVSRPPRITYLDVIYETDYANGRLPCGPYSKERYLDDMRNAAADLGADFFVRPHPKSDVTEFVGLPVDAEADADRCLANSDVLISPYSTMLFQAFLRGLPAISYQPWRATIRADVFDGRVDVVKSPAQLRPVLQRALRRGPRRPVVDDAVLYNPGRAAEFVAEYARNLL